MVAAICHAWLLGYRDRETEGGGRGECAVVPVMNVKRGSMWKLRQAAWLFHHAGLDATALLFAEEVTFILFDFILFFILFWNMVDSLTFHFSMFITYFYSTRFTFL